MNELLEKIKRLFESRPRPPAESIGESTSDRPPPPVEQPPPVEAASGVQLPPPTIEAPPSREPAAIDRDELAEIRAALEAVAEPVRAPEPEADLLFPAPDPTPTAVPPPTPAPSPTPQRERATEQEAVEAPAPEQEIVEAPEPIAESEPSLSSVDQVGEALVLTLGTPPVTFTVAKTAATLGRGQENTIRLDDLSVSRRHARIAFRQGGYWLSDLGSMGGTWVDGTRLNAPRRLAAGEVIDIGLLRLSVGFAGASAKTETRAAAETKKIVGKPRSEIAGQVRRRR